MQLDQWQIALRDAISDPKELLHELNIKPETVALTENAFALRVPKSYLKRINPSDPNDPLLLQVLPLHKESAVIPDFVKDPVGEQSKNPLPGLIHKYQSRVLLTLSSACGIHCRYCFRRHFNYFDNNPGTAGWETVLVYIRNDTTIHEVILSGGDPLTANDQQLKKLCFAISEIPHINTLRIHTRMPIVIPERITENLIEIFKSVPLKMVMVMHCNHAQEINDEVKSCFKKLHHAGILLLNQTVLLENINDKADTLIKLSHVLFSANVLPYYLHLLDKVDGAAHFEVSEEDAKQIYHSMLTKLPGYLVPRLVREVSNAGSKIPIDMAETFIQE